MKLIEEMMNKKAELEIAPLIDVVFLLLIYFMVTASLVKKEADLSFMLPAKVDVTEPLDLPIEVLIEVSELGDIVINGMVFAKDQNNMDDLIGQLLSLKEAADSSGTDLIVNIMPADKALHGRIIRVMDACAAANVKNMSFSMSM
ncbi:ExbD/TolR family protein [Pontiella agarivorans]|uniref:Biopolymer transporter ExbD n=1 Tax=Pontiella agarivorans TaxID=3038953 RepID=A0ABU5N1J5_9BACT|nr:biopolymer transporter ExbD [Pontiella agarivorans]MDZ8120116.1 biopolymer transporter ExbD [Pontiella agarivorans]